MAILIPVYLGYSGLISLEAERLQAFASLPLILFTYLFGQFAIYRARRYRHVAHGVARRAFLDDRLGLGLCVLAFGCGASSPCCTLGLALPWSHAVARTLQDAALALRQRAGRIRRPRLGVLQARLWLWLVAMDRCSRVALTLPFSSCDYYASNGGGTAMEARDHGRHRRRHFDGAAFPRRAFPLGRVLIRCSGAGGIEGAALWRRCGAI